MSGTEAQTKYTRGYGTVVLSHSTTYNSAIYKCGPAVRGASRKNGAREIRFCYTQAHYCLRKHANVLFKPSGDARNISEASLKIG